MIAANLDRPQASVLPLLRGATWPGAAEAWPRSHALPIPTSKTEAWKVPRVGRHCSSEPYAAPKGETDALPRTPAYRYHARRLRERSLPRGPER